MPHTVVKVRSGYSQRQQARLSAALSKAIVETFDCPLFDVSVGIEDIRTADAAERVYEPDIRGKRDTIYQHPGYAAPH